MNTPDTEWEKEFDEIWEARPAPEQRTHLKEAIKEFISSHTTYLKERVLETLKVVYCTKNKYRDDGVHIDYKCPDCGQKWGEEEKTPVCLDPVVRVWDIIQALDNLK